MDLHHLHVVDYDRNSKVYISEECQTSEKTHKRKPHKNNLTPSPNILSKIQQSIEVTKPQAKSTENSSKTKVIDAVQSARTLSLDDIGKIFKKCNSFNIKQNLKNRLKSNRLKIKNMMYKESKESQDDIKVLYASQRLGEHGIKNEIEFKIDRSAAPCDKKSKNVVKTQSMPCRWKNRRLSKSNMNSNNGIQKSKSDVLPANRLLETCHHAKRDEICYAIAGQSREFKDSNNDKESLRRSFIEEKAKLKGIYITVPALKDRKPPEPLLLCEGTNEIGTVTSNIIKPPTLKVDKRCGTGRTVSKARKKSNAFVAIVFKMLLTILKYFLLALTVIVWSPCFIVAFMFWHVVSPLTPNDVRTDKLVPACSKCRNGFLSKLVECVTRSYMKIVCVFKTAIKITSTPICYDTCAAKVIEQSPFDPQCNTDKKYIVYHSEQRGWLMKPMRGQHKRILPNRISSVSSILTGKRSRNKKSVSFWDSVVTDRYNQSSILQTSVSQHANKSLSPDNEIICCKRCLCVHENKPPDTIIQQPKTPTSKATKSIIPKPHVECQCSTSKDSETQTSKSHVICECPIAKTPKATRVSVDTSKSHVICECPITKTPKATRVSVDTSKSHVICECPITKTPKATRVSVDTSKSHVICECPITKTAKATKRSVDTSCHRSQHYSKVKQPPPRKKIIVCPHHKPVLRRPKTCQSDPEIGRERRSRSRSSSHHYHGDQRTYCDKRPRSQQRYKRQSDEKHHQHRSKKRSQNNKPDLAAGDRTQNKERPCKQIFSFSYKKDKLPNKNQKSCVYNNNLKKTKWDLSCKDTFLLTLKEKPYFWVYTLCPSMYPHCLTTCKMLGNCCNGILFICAACIWCPIILCLYFCYYLICDCMSAC